MSSYELTVAEREVLSRDLNFNQGKQPDTRKVGCALENAIGLLEENERDDVCTRAVGILSRIRNSGGQQVLSKDEQKAVKSLHENKNIAVLPAGMGNVTVVLDRSAYHSEMEEIVGDCTTYSKFEKDPNSKIQTCLQKTLSSIFQMLPASAKRQYYRLLCTNIWFCPSDIQLTEDPQNQPLEVSSWHPGCQD